MFAEKQDYINKIFEFITSSRVISGFTTNQNNEIVEAFENGERQGQFYKAWSIVFSSSELFKPAFQKYFNILPPPPTQEKTPKPISLENDILNKENALIRRVPINDVYNHFKTLTKMTSRKDEVILTNEQLLIFIKATFIDNKPIKQSWNSNDFTKISVRRIFFNFYLKVKNKESNYKNIKPKYFNIMNDAFEGFNNADYKAFHRT